MIPRLSQADRLRACSPVARNATPGPSEAFVRSSSDSAGIYQARPEWKAEPPSSPGAWRTGILTAVLMATATVGVAAVPAQSLAAELTAPKSKEAIKAEGLKLLLSSKAAGGQTASLPEALAAMRPEAARLVQTLPPQAQQAYAELEPPAKAWLYERIQGTTPVALGLIEVNNREAFVSGSAYGQDVFAVARKGLQKQVRAGTIPAELEGRLNSIVDLLARLSPEQRGNLVGALEAELR